MSKNTTPESLSGETVYKWVTVKSKEDLPKVIGDYITKSDDWDGATRGIDPETFDIDYWRLINFAWLKEIKLPDTEYNYARGYFKGYGQHKTESGNSLINQKILKQEIIDAWNSANVGDDFKDGEDYYNYLLTIKPTLAVEDSRIQKAIDFCNKKINEYQIEINAGWQGYDLDLLNVQKLAWEEMKQYLISLNYQ